MVKIGLFLYIRDRAWILGKTLDSILKQTYNTKNIHLRLLFNDCEDSSKAIAEDFKQKNLDKFHDIEIYEWNFNEESDDRRVYEKRQKAIHRMAFLKNLLFNSFVNSQTNYDKLMFFDSDIILNENAIELMVKADKDIIGGVVKTHPRELGIYNYLFYNPLEGMYRRLREINGLERVDYISGFTMFDKKTFSKIKFGFKFNGSSDDDFAMDIARENGFEIWADTNITGEHVMNRV